MRSNLTLQKTLWIPSRLAVNVILKQEMGKRVSRVSKGYSKGRATSLQG